jgi:hypothetical protein
MTVPVMYPASMAGQTRLVCPQQGLTMGRAREIIVSYLRDNSEEFIGRSRYWPTWRSKPPFLALRCDGSDSTDTAPGRRWPVRDAAGVHTAAHHYSWCRLTLIRKRLQEFERLRILELTRHLSRENLAILDS